MVNPLPVFAIRAVWNSTADGIAEKADVENSGRTKLGGLQAFGSTTVRGQRLPAFASASLESTQTARLARRSDIGTLGVDRSPLHINVCRNEKAKLSGAQRNVVFCTASLDVSVKQKLR